jgi:protein TonB
MASDSDRKTGGVNRRWIVISVVALLFAVALGIGAVLAYRAWSSRTGDRGEPVVQATRAPGSSPSVSARVPPDSNDPGLPVPTASQSNPIPGSVPRIVVVDELNGKAISLPKPEYPAAAKSAGASGQVSVYVMIDESGAVIRAKAVSGHPLLHDAAVQAARAARFSPSTQSGQPVMITGTLFYTFVEP